MRVCECVHESVVCTLFPCVLDSTNSQHFDKISVSLWTHSRTHIRTRTHAHTYTESYKHTPNLQLNSQTRAFIVTHIYPCTPTHSLLHTRAHTRTILCQATHKSRTLLFLNTVVIVSRWNGVLSFVYHRLDLSVGPCRRMCYSGWLGPNAFRTSQFSLFDCFEWTCCVEPTHCVLAPHVWLVTV